MGLINSEVFKNKKENEEFEIENDIFINISPQTKMVKVK